jgi:hypothetical protein
VAHRTIITSAPSVNGHWEKFRHNLRAIGLASGGASGRLPGYHFKSYWNYLT